MAERQKQISIYNEAAMQMQRLHNIWLSCGSSRERGNIVKYENSLRNAETELKYDAFLLSDGLKKDHESNYIEKILNLNKKITKCNILISKTKNTIYYQASINRKWALLIEKEELLREIQEESGKGGKRGNPDEDDEID